MGPSALRAIMAPWQLPPEGGSRSDAIRPEGGSRHGAIIARIAQENLCFNLFIAW